MRVACLCVLPGWFFAVCCICISINKIKYVCVCVCVCVCVYHIYMYINIYICMYTYNNTRRSDVSGLMLIFMLQGLIYQCVFSFRPWTRSLPSNPVTVFIHGLFSSFQYIHAQASNIFSSVGVSVSLFFNRARSRV